MINQIMKYTTKRIESRQTNVTLQIQYIDETIATVQLDKSSFYGKQYNNEGIKIDADIEYKIIFDTGNSSATIVGTGFLNYMSALQGRKGKNIKYNKLLFPMTTKGIGGEQTTTFYIKMKFKFNKTSIEYDIYPTVDYNPKSATYNTLLLYKYKEYE